jgi:hydrogenase maturation protein HypF
VRLGLVVRGVVQGVGFRPFVWRCAVDRGLGGCVENDRDGVRIEVEGAPAAIESFAMALERELPRAASIRSTERALLVDRGDHDFVIRRSERGTTVAPVLPPDLAPCRACWDEVFDPESRRYRYPFTSCAACGPRHSIVEELPYDRERTTMRDFTMCEACRRQYDDVSDRRHHAQPIACSTCGPQLRWITGKLDRIGDAALLHAAASLRRGRIVALRGVGGFQLLVDALDDQAVGRLRARKRRPDKPLAVLFADVDALREHAEVSASEVALLESCAAPIVLVARSERGTLAPQVGRASASIGAMLPASMLHALLVRDVGRPLVCTSGNLSGEPMATTIEEARAQLGEVADGFLTHDRPIARALDDSVARMGCGAPMLLRRARGFASAPIAEAPTRSNGLALGAHMKSTVTLVHDGALVPSQHLGDLGGIAARARLEQTAFDLCRFFDARPRWIACDAHPEYASTRFAESLAARWQVPLFRVQHHHAHVAACIAEHAPPGESGLSARAVLGLTWDGTGWGEDGVIWGGEALRCRGRDAQRLATLRSFVLPGGELAAREPRRAALGLLYTFRPDRLERALDRWPAAERRQLRRALEREVNSPRTSSMGRLFDAVAALLGLSACTTFEGQAAIALEQLAAETQDAGAYLLPLGAGQPALLDTAALLDAILDDLDRGVDRRRIAARFHAALGAAAVAIAACAGEHDVVLAGGCFQNRVLVERTERALRSHGHAVHVPRRLPANDGAISVGQAWLQSLPPA